MIENTKKDNKVNIKDRHMPTTIEQLIQQYDLENTKVYEFLDSLVLQVNEELDKKYNVTGGNINGNITATGKITGKSVNNYQYHSITGATGSAKYVKLGTLTSNKDNANTIIKVYSGDGYNGRPNQNAIAEIMIKNGWQSSASATSAFGTLVLLKGYNSTSFKVYVMATSATKAEVWVYFPWTYWNGHYSVEGEYDNWEDSRVIQDTEPSTGTSNSVEYQVLTKDTIVSNKFQGGVIELYHSSTPYIDFHYANDSSDYTSRIIEAQKGLLKVTGKISIGDTSTVNTTDTWIPVIKSGEIQHTLRKFATAKTHTDYNNNQDYLPTMSFLSFWNGAYNSNNTSNLTYCYQGEIQAKPTKLYDNASGTTGTVTLSKTAANFTFIEIHYQKGGYYNSTKIIGPNGKKANLILAYPASSTVLQMIYKNVTISETSVTVSNTGYNNMIGGSANTVSFSDNTILITRVLGYK